MRPYRQSQNNTGLSIIEAAENVFLIKGELSFSTINKDTPKLVDCAQATNLIRIDLKDVTSFDSAGLALMIEWLKISKRHNGTISFINIPQQLKTLAKISGFDHNLKQTLQSD